MIKDLDSYMDMEAVSAWAKIAMEWAVGGGLITGRTETTLAPQDTATRAEASAVLQRFVTLVA